MNFSLVIHYILQRMKEPSSWGGLTVLLTLIGVNLSPDQAATIVNFLAALGSVLMLALPERGGDSD
jgi:hypothetical protein